jgi:hypothetical protein
MRYIVNSLSPKVLAHALGLNSTYEVWDAIETIFASQSRARIQHMCSALNNTKKLDFTIVQFFTKMRGVCFELPAAGKLLKMMNWGYLLNGLDGL